MIYEHSRTVQRHRQSGNLEETVTDGLTGVGARDDNIHVYCTFYTDLHCTHVYCILLVRFALAFLRITLCLPERS